MITPPKDALMVDSIEDKQMLEKLSFEQLYEILYKQSKKQKNNDADQSNESDGKGGGGLGQNIDFNNVKEDLVRPKNVQKTSSNMRRIIQESIITNKMQGNKTMGDMPGNLLRRIEELIGTRLPWHKYLRRYLSNIASDDLSFDTPDKNHIYRDLILPGVYEDEEKLEDILFVIDTSGSISDDDLNNFMNQAYNICKDFNATGKIIFFDSIVQDIFDIDKDSFKKARPAGGEGTNVDSALSYIRDNRLKYICAVVLTDGYFPRPTVLIRNVIWCLTEDATRENVEGYKGSKIIKM